MKAIARFFKLNYDFSPEFAAAHHGGEESENNRKFDWEDEMEVTQEVAEIQTTEKTTYHLQGDNKGTPFSEEVPNVMQFDFLNENKEPIAMMVCSMSIVKEWSVEEQEDKLILTVFLEDREPLVNPIPGVYIALQEFPKSLI